MNSEKPFLVALLILLKDHYRHKLNLLQQLNKVLCQRLHFFQINFRITEKYQVLIQEKLAIILQTSVIQLHQIKLLHFSMTKMKEKALNQDLKIILVVIVQPQMQTKTLIQKIKDPLFLQPLRGRAMIIMNTKNFKKNWVIWKIKSCQFKPISIPLIKKNLPKMMDIIQQQLLTLELQDSSNKNRAVAAVQWEEPIILIQIHKKQMLNNQLQQEIRVN